VLAAEASQGDEGETVADFDEAERNAIQEVEPKDQVRWLLEEVDDDLVLFGWLQTQVAPPPGVPQLRCDCVAGLHSLSGTQAPWACLIEAQGQPLAGMAVWMMIYLGLLHNVLRYEGRDSYRMMGVILNLSDSKLSHDIDWQVPLKKPAATDATSPAPAPPASSPGVVCKFFIKNVRHESAEKTLDRIDRGELGLCILVWVPLMLGADAAEVVRRWRDLAMRQQQLHLRGNYAVLALVFAEMAGRKTLWETELGGFNLQESTVMNKWRKEATEKGIEMGALTTARAAVLNVLQVRFPGASIPDGVRSAVEKNDDVRLLADWLGKAAVTASPGDFERSVVAPVP
jgi:hypothetical protein